MTTLIAKDLAAGHGDKVLFADLELVVAPGDVIGLVGPNGAGKSTLLRTLAGLIPAEQGSIALNPPTATVGYLPQEPDRRPGETVRAFLGRRTGVAAAQADLDAATEALTEGRPGADEAYA
ncbi:MAG TPA: ATP-binding cassette domain-containing protein, partial [Asanoa sp.]|nr:ATP-binding cassette domain-containing protein [Asanoa sp.]